MSIITTITVLSTKKKTQMICHLHRFLHKKEDIERHLINYCTSIRQDNNTVCAENYCMKIIMYITSFFICATFWKIFCVLWFQ